jgi:hypothetical protein
MNLATIEAAADEFAEERAAIREFDGGFTREEATRLGMLDSREWMLACLVREIGTQTADKRKARVEEFRKRHGNEVTAKLIDGLIAFRKTRESAHG